MKDIKVKKCTDGQTDEQTNRITTINRIYLRNKAYSMLYLEPCIKMDVSKKNQGYEFLKLFKFILKEI